MKWKESKKYLNIINWFSPFIIIIIIHTKVWNKTFFLGLNKIIFIFILFFIVFIHWCWCGIYILKINN